MPRSVLRSLFAFTGFIAALLLFQVQPLLGKRLLPWFGGSPATWAACMLFFQLVLLAGYALADLLARKSAGRVQLALCGAVVAAGLALLPLGPAVWDRPEGAGGALQVLLLLARHAALPCLALALASPLLQHWYGRATQRAPYGLYAWSNAGSFVGLLSYPFAVEPLLSQTDQQRLWSVLFALFALGLLLCGALSAARAEPGPAAPPGEAPPGSLRLRWTLAAAVSSALLLSVTNQLTLDIAAVPFLWVAPLALYLLTFVLAFADPERDLRRWLLPAWVLGSVALAVDPFAQTRIPASGASALLLGALFAGCWLCHGELARTRPAPAQLSRFYLAIAAGGALGGLFVAGIAPLWLPDQLELQLALFASYALLLAGLSGERDAQRRRAAARFIWLGVGLCVPLLAGSLWTQARGRTQGGQLVERRRSFHGQLSVTDLDEVRLLSHGRIRHGLQFRDPTRQRRPTLYYGPDSGVGRALRLHAGGRPRRIGMVGLGAGTLAVYAQPGDRMTFYELNPDVVDLARRRFGFLAAARGAVDIEVGDARIALERAAPEQFDLLIVDAFASDAVPVHLLTVEAFAVYLRHLRADGVLLINVANRHVDIERVVAGAAAHHGLALRALETPRDEALGLARVRWDLLAREPAPLEELLAGKANDGLHGPPVAFTDDFSDLLSVLR